MKRFIYAALLVSAATVLYAQSNDDFQVLQKPDGTITVTGYTGTVKAVQVPSNIYDQPVSEIGSNAFAGNTTLQSVALPDSVTTIGNAAFSGCSVLNIARLGTGVQTIGDAAFSGTRLNTIDFPSGLRSIGNEAFAGNNLSSISLPDSVTRVGVDAFARNRNLSEILIGTGMENVFFNAFGAGDNKLALIAVRKDGLNLASIGLDQSFVNVYTTSGAGVYVKRGNVWLKDASDPYTYVLGLSTSIAAKEDAEAVAAAQAEEKQSGDLVGKTWIVYFPENSTAFTGLSPELTGMNKKTLDEVIALITQNKSVRLRVTGHVNALNSTEADERRTLRPLSLRRAEVVARILDFYGAGKNRVIVTGVGGSAPLAAYASRKEWYRNRRAEITVIR